MGFSILNLLKQHTGSIRFSKINLFYLYIIITWVSLNLAINTMPDEMYKMFDSPIKFINSLRFAVPLIISTVNVLILVYLFFNKKIKNTSLLLILFSFYFLSQIVGLINTPARDFFDLENTHLIIFALGILSSLILLDNYKSKRISYTLLCITLLIFTAGYIFIITNSPEFLILAIQDGSLHNLFNINKEFFEQSGPRITGATRMIAIFTLFCLTIILVEKKNYKINYLIYILILLLSLFIWLGQSRGSLLCYYTTLFLTILFLNNLSLLKKLILIVSIPVLSILISNVLLENSKKITKIYVKHLEETKTETVTTQEIKERIKNSEKFSKNNSSLRVIDNKTSSGRFEIWKESIREYKKDKIFGYGPQGDRYILWKRYFAVFYSSNSSNLLIYGFLSGGYVGLFILILIYFYILVMLLKFFIVNKLYLLRYKITKSNFFYAFSIITTIFFLIRSLFENSYGLFSIDFLLMIISLYILELNYQNKQT